MINTISILAALIGAIGLSLDHVESRVLPLAQRSVAFPRSEESAGSRQERPGESDNELDEIGLTASAGLCEDAKQMRFDCTLSNSQLFGDLRNPANLDDREQHIQFHGS